MQGSVEKHPDMYCDLGKSQHYLKEKLRKGTEECFQFLIIPFHATPHILFL
jgi:hypothetical protein